MRITASAFDASILPSRHLLEGEDLPDFWCRKIGDSYLVFIANPLSRSVSYPMEYGYAFTDKGSSMKVRVNHHSKSEETTLVSQPMQSLLLEIDRDGIHPMDLGYVPPVLPSSCDIPK